MQEDEDSLKINEIYQEILTAGGCSRAAHLELTIGLGPFEAKTCPICKLEIYRP